VTIDSVTPRVTRLGLPELLSSLTSKQKKGALHPGTVCVKQVTCDKRALSVVVLAQVALDDATGKPVAQIAAVAVCASASQARAVQEALRNIPTASPNSGAGATGAALHGLFGPNLFPDAAAQVSPLRGLEGPTNVSGQGDFDNMSDFGDDVTKGAKSQELVRVLVHANPSQVCCCCLLLSAAVLSALISRDPCLRPRRVARPCLPPCSLLVLSCTLLPACSCVCVPLSCLPACSPFIYLSVRLSARCCRRHLRHGYDRILRRKPSCSTRAPSRASRAPSLSPAALVPFPLLRNCVHVCRGVYVLTRKVAAGRSGDDGVAPGRPGDGRNALQIAQGRPARANS
jgi:hypothetical protein